MATDLYKYGLFLRYLMATDERYISRVIQPRLFNHLDLFSWPLDYDSLANLLPFYPSLISWLISFYEKKIYFFLLIKKNIFFFLFI